MPDLTNGEFFLEFLGITNHPERWRMMEHHVNLNFLLETEFPELIFGIFIVPEIHLVGIS